MNDRTLTVAAIQMESRNGDIAGNLARAGRWTDAAARQGAELVLLPELFSTGFEINANAWHSAEPQGGPTETWLAETARRHRCHIGGSYLEARDGDFYNTFALAAPDGSIAGRVRKAHPCSLEAYVFKAGDDAHVIDTALGRIGVAICYDGCLRATWDDILARDPDLVLMPLSAPTPMKTWFYGDRQIEAFHAAMRDSATASAAGLGIPVLLANKWGEWKTELPSLWPRQTSSFPGFSHIADSDGREVARMGDGEGVIVAEVRLAPARKHLALSAESARYRPWIFKVPAEFKFFRWFEALGRRWYARHPERARLATRPPANA
jgi:N-carbamoylputrescine amidase